LEEQGLVDDLRYSRLYLSSQSRSRPRSVRLLMRDLGRAGVEPETIRQAVGGMAPELDEKELARSALRKKQRVAGSDPGRLRRLLAARGFPRRIIEEVLREAGLGS